jgi:hypothetical protein
VTFTFLTLVDVLKLWGTFAVFGALSFICCLYVWKAVPETKGRTLEQIQESWSKYWRTSAAGSFSKVARSLAQQEPPFPTSVDLNLASTRKRLPQQDLK